MSTDIVDRLGILGEALRLEHWPFWWTNYCHDGAAEIVRLRERVTELEAENLRVRRYAEEKYAQAERRLISTNAERALADQLAEALRLADKQLRFAALDAYDRARKENR